MIRICALSVHGFPEAIRGMRNPYNSWDKSDSRHLFDPDNIAVGPKDKELMRKLVAGGPVHAKFRRMITVAMDITAPLYWWKEFDTYKVGTVANSCSTMHTITQKEFTLEDFSCEKLINDEELGTVYADKESYDYDTAPAWIFDDLLSVLNKCREKYIETKDKRYWWQIIQLLPSSYNQTRTVMLNYEVLSNMYHSRKNHKLDEWVDFCRNIEIILPMADELICK